MQDLLAGLGSDGILQADKELVGDLRVSFWLCDVCGHMVPDGLLRNGGILGE